MKIKNPDNPKKVIKPILQLDSESSSGKTLEIYYKTLLENIPHPMWAYDCETKKILFVNKSFSLLYEYSHEELLEMPINNLVVDVKLSGTGKRREKHKKKNGSFLDVEITQEQISVYRQTINIETIHVITEQLRSEQLHKVMYDISEAVNTKNTLSQLYSSVYELFKKTIQVNNFLITIYSSKEDQISFPFVVDEKNVEFSSRSTGKYLEEYVIRTKKSLFCTQSVFDSLVNNGEIQPGAFQPKVWVGIPLIVQNTAIGVLVVYDYANEKLFGKSEQDILEYATVQIAHAIERRLAVLAIQEHELNLFALLENTEDAIWSLDKDYVVVTFNSSAKNLFQKIFQLEMNEGLHLVDTLPSEMKETWKELYSRALQNERFSIKQHYDGEIHPLDLDIAFNPIVNEVQKVTGVSVFVKNITDQQREEEHQRRRVEQVLQHQRVLTDLAKSEYPNLQTALNTITMRNAETLNVKQVGIWSFSDDRKEIICDAFYSGDLSKDMKGVRLKSVDYPHYFHALETTHAIVADDANSDPLTSEFSEFYLKPYGITSMMDVPIHLHGKVIGIVCHEHIGPQKTWSLEEQEFATSIAELVSIAYETSHRKEAELALRQSEERYRMFISQSTEAIWRYELEQPISTQLPIDEQLKLCYQYAYLAECNDEMAQMYGFERKEDLLGARLGDTLTPSEARNIEMLELFFHSGYRLDDQETLEYDKDGTAKYFLNNLVGIIENGYLLRAWGTQRDITDKKRADNELMRLGHALRSISECVCITDLNNKVMFINKAFVQTYDITEQELLGYDVAHFFYEGNGINKSQEILEMTLKGGWQGEILNKRKDGTLFTSYLSTSIIRDEHGSPIALIGVSNDIEERKKIESTIRESESRFRILTETVESAIIIYQDEGYIYANPAAERLLGYTKEELVQKKFWQVVHTDFRELIRQRGMSRQRGEEVPSRYEFKIVRKDGEERWIDFAAALIKYEGIQAVLGTAFDITERKRAENLQSAVYRIAQAAEGVTDLESLFHAVHSIVDEVMPAKNFYIALYDELTDTVSFPYYIDEEDQPPEPQQGRRGLTEYVLRTGRSLLSNLEVHEDLIRRGEIESIGSMSPIWLGVPLIVGKKTIGVMTVQHYSDSKAYGEREQQMLEYVSTQVAKTIEQKRTTELLRSNERRFRTLIENSTDVVVLLDAEGVIQYESQAVTKILGYSTEDRIGKNVFEHIHVDDLERVKALFTDILNKPSRMISGVYRVKHANGSWRWIESSGINILHDSNIRAIVSNYRDITERKNAVEALSDSEERFRSLFECATDAIFTLSLNGIITSLNPAFEKITGWNCQDWIGRSISTLIHQDDNILASRSFQETVLAKQPPAYELRVNTKSGAYFIGEFTSTPLIQHGEVVGILGIARDITERKKLEEEIRYIQKMESIGILAGGVAHDFNNILAIINAYAGSLKLAENMPPKFIHNVHIIERTVERGARIVQQLLTLAKKTETVFSSITIAPLIDELSKLLHETFPKTIIFKTDLKYHNVKVAADSNQLYQVLLNLCLNARDAMHSGGTLTIASDIVTLNELIKMFPEATEERYLCLRVNDTGTGMDEETKLHIFDPFYTTKEKGKGTGLGLSVVYGIIENHKGFINVETALRHGTTFFIYLPLPLQIEEISPEEFTSDEEIEGGTETLLLVEDEETLIDLLEDILAAKGYTVIKAYDGEEALKKFSENKDQIKLVMTDMGLPKIGGYEAFRKMKKMNPLVKVILASGYLDSKVRSEMIAAGAEDFVQKPYDVTEIIQRIREVLDGKN